MSISERFWSKVDKRGPRQPHMATRCWVWMAASDKRYGYGSFWCPEMDVSGKKSKLQAAHRVAWWLKTGKIPVRQILHSCDNPSCVRHLREGTHSDNMRDRAARGRTNLKGRKILSMRSLTETQLQDVLERWRRGESGTLLAIEFGVNKHTMFGILRRVRRHRGDLHDGRRKK